MKRISAVVLMYLATVTQQGLAETTRQHPPVNQFNNPILQQQQPIIYQQHELEQQQAQLTASGFTMPQPPALLAAAPSALASSGKTLLNPALEIFGLGAGIGFRGLLSGDYNNDGITELVFGNPSSVVFGQAVAGKFQLQTQLSFQNGISELKYFRDLTGDGHYAFFIHDQRLQKLDLITRRVVATLDVGYTNSLVLQKPTSGTASLLLVQSNTNVLSVIDPLTLKVLHNHNGFSANIAALGSFTSKTKAQILLTDGSIYNFNSISSMTFEKSIAIDGHYKPIAVDVNQDGIDELLTSGGWSSISLLSPLTNEILWSKSTSHNIDALIVADADLDGKPDGLYGDGQWGSLYAFNLQTGENFWTIRNPEHGVTNIVIADLDNDGKQDIGWGSGYSSSGGDYFYIHDLATKALKWKNEDIHFPVKAVALADIDQDGDLDALAVSTSSDSGYGGGIIQAFDIQSRTRLWHTLAANNWGKTMHVLAHDLNNDGKTELIIGSSEIYTGMVRVLNGANGQEIFKTLLGGGDNITSMAVADLDHDGFSEIILGNGAEHTGSGGVFFTVLDGRTGVVKKKSPSLKFNWQGLMDLTPVEVNGNLIVYGLMQQNLYQYNYSQNTVSQLSSNNNYQHLTKTLVAGVPELAMTNSAGQLLRVSTSGAELASATVCADANPVGLASTGPDRVLFNCQQSFGEYDWVGNRISFNHPTQFAVAGDPQWVRHKEQDYFIVGGARVAVYNMQAEAALPQADPIKLTTHVLKSVSGTMTIPAEVDYFVLAGSPKAGQFSFTDRKAGKFIYQPAGSIGTETLKYYAVKGQAISPEAELMIDLTNAKPIADHLNVSTHWNKSIQLTLLAKDDDQEALQFSLTSSAKHGQLKLLDPIKGTVEYSPSGDSLEPVSFGFTAQDTLATSEQKNVVITLTNTAPVAVSKSYSTSYQTPVNGALQGQDADGDVLSYEISSQPSAGSLTLDGKNGLFVYTPSGDTDQSISFSFITKDKFASSTVQTVNISVKGEPKKSSGGALNWFALLTLILFAMRRRSSQ